MTFFLDNEDAKWRLPLDFHTYTLKKALFITFFTCNFPILRISLNWLAPVRRTSAVLVEMDDAVTFSTLCKQLLGC
jgi:hypothetical protein